MLRLTPLFIISLLLSSLLLSNMAAQEAAKTIPSPTQNADFQTVCLINTDADPGVFDKVSESVEAWGRWKVVEHPKDADLLLFLSEKKQFTTAILNPTPIFELNAYYQWPVVMELDTLTLAAVDRVGNRQLVAVSCERHHLPPAARWLVSRLRKKMDNPEKWGR
jgi:hypothetical protein